MKPYILPCLILGLLLGFSQCSNNKKVLPDKPEILIVDIDSAIKSISDVPFRLSEFIDTVKYISLETNDESIFGGLRGSSFMVTDKFTYADLKKFNLRTGKYIFSIGKHGRGPGEFTMAIGSATDVIDNRVFVLDNWIRKVFIYDSSNNFLNSIDISPELRNIGYLGNDNIILIRDHSYIGIEYQVLNLKSGQILLTREIKNLLHYLKENNKNLILSYGIGRNCHWYYDNKFQLYESFSDTIFTIKDDGNSYPRFYIKRKNFKPTLSDITDNESFSKNRSNYIEITRIFETPLFLFIYFSKGLGQENYVARFDKHLKVTKVVPHIGAFNNDISNIKISYIQNIQGLNYGISYLNSAKWNREFLTEMESIQQSLWNNSAEDLYNLLKKTKETDNGIVCLLHYKSNI